MADFTEDAVRTDLPVIDFNILLASQCHGIYWRWLFEEAVCIVMRRNERFDFFPEVWIKFAQDDFSLISGESKGCLEKSLDSIGRHKTPPIAQLVGVSVDAGLRACVEGMIFHSGRQGQPDNQLHIE
jgi:hypothetical protein